MDLKGRNFLTLKDFTPEEITYLLDLSAELKEKKKKGIIENGYNDYENACSCPSWNGDPAGNGSPF